MTSLIGGLTLGACSAFGVRSGTEQPRYRLVQRVGTLEIRRYDPRLAAETIVAGGEIAARSIGFRRLAGYIFGGNDGGRHIAMTAPVAQAGDRGPGRSIATTAPVAVAGGAPGGWSIRFFLPAALAVAPTPRDPRVHVVTVPAATMAVLRYSGLAGAATVARQTDRLQAALAGTGWHATGPAVAWFYDPPWTLPPLRRNEVAVPVDRAG